MGPQALGTGVHGPLPSGSVGLLLGRSSALMRGIRIFPGVIDSDFTGEIKIMVSVEKGVVVIPQGDRIAQLVLLPQFPTNNPVLKYARGDQGFGSTGPGVFWVSSLEKRPTLTLWVEGKPLHGLLDTGADTTVIAKAFWPKAWPLEASHSTLQGVGTAAAPLKSSKILKWRDEEGHEGWFQSFVLEQLPTNLWGRDVLNDMGAVLTTQPVGNVRRKKGKPFCESDKTGLGNLS